MRGLSTSGRGRPSAARLAVPAAALALAALAHGCTLVPSDSSVDMSAHYTYPPRGPAAKPGGVAAAKGSVPGDSMLSVRNGGGPNGFAFASSPFDLFPPFRWEVTGGRLNSESPGTPSGFFCTELDQRGSNPLEFWSLCAQPSGDGWQVWVSARGVGPLNPTTFTSTAGVDFAVEHDGASLRFYARRTGVGDYTLIATLAHNGATALVPSIGVAQMPAGGEVQFDNMRVVANGPLPGGATAAQVLARAVADAGHALMHASHDVDAGVEAGDIAADLAAAATDLAAAGADIKAAASTLPDPKAAKKAAKKVKAAAKAAAKAAKAVEKGKPGKSIGKTLWKGSMAVYEAAQTLDPHALPGGG